MKSSVFNDNRAVWNGEWLLIKFPSNEMVHVKHSCALMDV